ncbi:tubulin polyglutamylase TTLL6 isoform X2 [Elgaria multicarinata webbii]|uniref:tubulin polyglutamylase TTLL6 isoform X2 n=1 Tax=Elgaria multicarinata webbii TaxID=159646 RepID=UPI002FCD5BDC
MEMKTYQKINHFPGMSEICRKDLLARNMGRMLKLFPKEFNFFPRTWCLPADYGELQAFSRSKKHKTYICKPDSGCQGRGIFITRTVKDIKPGEDMICQLYISKPFIIDGFKFDLRVYVLVTSCEPLRVFVYKEGLARFATSAYSDPSHSNLDDVCMHLTNYSINKHSANFVRDEDSGSKRKLSTFNKYMEENGYETEQIWKDIDDVVIKTLVSAHPIIRHNYLTCFPNHTMWSACFEILGFDILLDRKLKPWLLEVNHSPSFSTDSWLDKEVKDQLLYDTLVLINLGACDKRKVLEEEKRRGKERLLKQCRNREARQQLQELRLKKDQKVALVREKKAELQGESVGEKIKISRPKVLNRASVVPVSAQLHVCSGPGPGPAFPLEHFSEEQEPKKEVACDDYSSVSQQENHGTGNCPETPANQSVRPYSSVPDLTKQNSSSTPEQYKSNPELRDTISSHHSATDVTIRTSHQLPDEFTKGCSKQSPCPHKHFPAMTQPRPEGATATDTACCGGPAIKNFRPFGEQSFRFRVRENTAVSRSASPMARMRFFENDKEKRALMVSEFFSKMNFIPPERNLRLLSIQQSSHFTSRAQSASLPREILGSRSAPCRRPTKYYNAHLATPRPMVQQHSLQDLLVISRMTNQSKQANEPASGDSPVNRV